MNPRDALHQQEILKDAMTRPSQRQYLERVMEDIYDKRNGPVVQDNTKKITGEIVAASLNQLLGRCETFYVSDDMAQVAAAASHGLDGTDAFTHDMWPTDEGFLLFERGYMAIDVWGKPLVTSALAWQRRSYEGFPGMMVWEFATLGDERDPLTMSLSAQAESDMASSLGSRLMLSGTKWISDGQRVGPPTFWVDTERYNRGLDPDVEATLPEEFRATTALTEAQNAGRIVMALLMLMNQTIAHVEKTDLRPKNPKRARRMKVPGMVTVIRLRREAAAYEPGMTHVEWQHRWLVRGHWRWAACGPHYPLAVEQSPGVWRARLYIAPFVKGPEGAPFKVTKKVNALVR